MSTNDEVIALVSDGILGNKCFLSAVSLLLYEYIVTFSQELSLVWARGPHRRRRLTGANVIFILNRYINLAYYVMHFLQLFPIYNWTSCVVTGRILSAVQVAPYLIYAAFSALRVYGINGRRCLIPLLIFTLSLVPFATNIYNKVETTIVPSAPPFACAVISDVSVDVANKFVIATRACTIAADALVLLATWHVTYHVKRSAERAHLKMTVSGMLFRDGTMYFAALTVINITHMICFTTGVFADFSIFLEVLTSVLISRFFLNLRQAYAPSDEDTTRWSGLELQFASSVIGNLDAPLSDVFDISQDSLSIVSEKDSGVSVEDDIPLKAIPNGTASWDHNIEQHDSTSAAIPGCKIRDGNHD